MPIRVVWPCYGIKHQSNLAILFDVHNVMIHSRSVFSPIPSQFQDQQIFVKRDTLYKRLPKTLSNHFSSLQEKSKTLPIHDNYSNLKKKLEEYIHKEKHKMQLSFLGNTETIFTKEKCKLIFRKNKPNNKKSQHSIFSIPSEEIKMSFTEQLLNGKTKYEKVNIHSSNSEHSFAKEGLTKGKIRKIPHFNLRYESTDQSTISYHQTGEEPKTVEQKLNATSLQLPQERPFLIKRKKGRSKATNELTKNCQILGKRYKPEVLIYPSFSSMEVQELERKKQELMRINKVLKFRNTTKLCLKRISQKSNDVGPWSKANHQQEEENALEQSESFCEQ